MNRLELLLGLIKSMGKSEKRYFRLFTNLQKGEKVYLTLFDLLEQYSSVENVQKEFLENYSGKSLEMASKHLYKIILDCLVKLRDKQDIQTKIFNYISKAGVLFERELFDEAFLYLEKAKKLAVTYEYDPLLLLIRRTELKYLSAREFEGVSEKQLVNKQMKINEVMKYSRNINLHLQLYDILKYRLAYKGYSRSDKQKEDLNDLVLSELSLISHQYGNGFESQKLHLLFQATYYLNSGNYKSAIRHYRELIGLFEENRHIILNPPIYYVSALKGILDSLHTAGLYHEMVFFIQKLKVLEQEEYAEEFVLEIKWLIFLYELVSVLNIGNFTDAVRVLEKYCDPLYKKVELMRLDTQVKLHLYMAIVYLCLGKLDDTRKSMKKIFASGKLFYSLPSYKIARLFNLVVQAELQNFHFFENEINSIKRNLKDEKQFYHTEKLVFKFVSNCPLPTYKPHREKLWQSYKKQIDLIQKNKYERQILKIFDFLSWIESKFTKRPFNQILTEKALI